MLDDVGNSRAKLSQRAQAILLAEREGRRDEGLIREAALLPALHKEMWGKYGAKLPSDESLKYELVTEKGFTQGGADEFLSEWKRTMTYAKLSEADATLSPNGGETPSTPPQDPVVTPPATITESPEVPPAAGEQDTTPIVPERTSRTVQVTYSPDEWALFQAKFPMSEEDWDAMIAVLQAMKRGLVGSA